MSWSTVTKKSDFGFNLIKFIIYALTNLRYALLVAYLAFAKIIGNG